MFASSEGQKPTATSSCLRVSVPLLGNGSASFSRQLQGAGSGEQRGWLSRPAPWLHPALHSRAPTALGSLRNPPRASATLPESKLGESRSKAEALAAGTPVYPRRHA